MSGDNHLGEFLRARREIITPAQVGMPDAGPRRTPGLRREEVAALAHVSADYYMRLEQGRERHPSVQVLNALVRALNLGPDAAAHLHELTLARSRRRAATGPKEEVGPNVLRLLRDWRHTPVFVVNGFLDVLATNPLTDVLHDGMEYADNLLRLIFLDPAAHDFYQDWEQIAFAKTACLRAAVGPEIGQPRLTELVEELSSKSKDFDRVWTRYDVADLHPMATRVRHHEAGDLSLNCRILKINSAPGQRLVFLHTDPASPSEQALELLVDRTTTSV